MDRRQVRLAAGVAQRECLADLIEPVAVGVEDEHLVRRLRLIAGGAGREVIEQRVEILDRAVDHDQLDTGLRIGRLRAGRVVDQTDLRRLIRIGLVVGRLEQVGSGGGVEDDAALQLLENEVAEASEFERHGGRRSVGWAVDKRKAGAQRSGGCGQGVPY